MTVNNAQIVEQVKAARRVSTPLIGIVTPDPGATTLAISQATNGKGPRLSWDVVRGFTAQLPEGMNKAGVEALGALFGDSGRDASVNNPPLALQMAMKLPERSLLFIHMANRWFSIPAFVQSLWLLRDAYKADGRTVVLLGPTMDLPPEVSGDVVVLDEPLPGAEQLGEIIQRVHDDNELTIQPAERGRAVEAVQGLTAFQAEQVVAMSIDLETDAVDLPSLWERKRRQIELTPGLKVHRGDERFDGIGGVEVIKRFLSQIFRGQARPNAVVFIDEIEKMLRGGANGRDTSGVSQDQLGSLLSYMQDHGAVGMIFVGPPGSAKSMVAKAAGNEAGVPTICLDLGGVKGSLVGQSEGQLRAALKVITSVSNGRSLWIATCNAIHDLPPELRRRFTLGTYFFDLPDEDERAQIWALHRGARGIAKKLKAPQDEGWTGAEIRQCCDIAWRLDCTLEEAAAYVVPVAVSASEQIANLRRAATGKFLSASHAGVYRFDEHTGRAAGSTRPGRGGRRISREQDA